jgi:hypothetical protein
MSILNFWYKYLHEILISRSFRTLIYLLLINKDISNSQWAAPSVIFVNFTVCGRKRSRHSLYSDWLRDGRSGDRISVFARFSATFQTGSGVHPASGKNGFRFLFSGVKTPGHGIYYPPLSSAEVKERLELTFLPLWTLTACHILKCTLSLFIVYLLNYNYSLRC